MGSFKTTLAYLCFGLIMVAVFLYALFPDQAIRDYLESRLAAVDPSLAITAEGIRPAIPPGVKMHGVALSRNGVRMASFDNARLSMDLATLLKAQKRFQFEAQVADGSINGRGVMEGTGPAARLRTEADLEAVRLEALEGIQSLPNVSLAGPVNGRLTHEGALAPAG